MNKENLLELLYDYNSDYVEEVEYKKRTIDFINSNENIFGKLNEDGHITGSSWIISKDKKKVLLTHHNKLDKWLQLGGHTELNETVLETALREAREESGLSDIKILCERIFDIDVHLIPANNKDKEHYHYDIRFILEGNLEEEIKISNESKDVLWIDINDVNLYSQSNSILRMVEKTEKY